MQRKVEQIIKKLSIKYNIPKHIILSMVQSPFHLITNKLEDIDVTNIKEEELPIFQVMHVGQFRFSMRKIKKNLENGSNQK